MPEQPQSDPAPAELVTEWSRAVSRIEAAQHQVRTDVANSGIPAQWFEVLRLLSAAEDGRLPMSAIARDLAMTSGGFTKLADRMAREGLIDRRSASADRRVVYATLTERGRDWARTAARVYARAVGSHVLAAIAPADVRALAEIAERLESEHPVVSEPVAPEDEFVMRNRLPASPERRGREPNVTLRADRSPETGRSVPRS